MSAAASSSSTSRRFGSRKDGRRSRGIADGLTDSDTEGEIIGFSTIARDISSRLRADRAGRRLAAIVESSDDAIVSKDLNGIVTSWNRAAEKIFGYTAAEMVGQSIRMLIPDDRQSEEDHVLGAASGRASRSITSRPVRRRKDGTLFRSR